MSIEQERVRTTFDRRAIRWESKGRNRTVVGCHERLESVLRAVLETGDQRSGADLGCGSGRIANALLAASHRIHVTMCDISHEMLRVAATNSIDSSRCEFLECDLAAIPLPDESFELVAMQQVLHHVPSSAAVLDEARRVMATDGQFAVLGLSSGHQEQYFPFDRSKQDGDPLGRMHADNAVTLVTAAGFEVQRIWIDGFIFMFDTVMDYARHMDAIGTTARLKRYQGTPIGPEELANQVGRDPQDTRPFQVAGEYFTILARPE